MSVGDVVVVSLNFAKFAHTLTFGLNNELSVIINQELGGVLSVCCRFTQTRQSSVFTTVHRSRGRCVKTIKK